MRYAVIALAGLLLVRPAAATTGAVDPGTSLGIVQQWIYNYRAKPDPAHVPAAVRVLFKTQTFKARLRFAVENIGSGEFETTIGLFIVGHQAEVLAVELCSPTSAPFRGAPEPQKSLAPGDQIALATV
jgi:hypothetical protein